MDKNQDSVLRGISITLVPGERVVEENLAANAMLAEEMRSKAGYLTCASI